MAELRALDHSGVLPPAPHENIAMIASQVLLRSHVYCKAIK